MQSQLKKLISELNLDDYAARFTSSLAREKPLFMEGDTALHFRFIKALENADITPPLSVKNLDVQLVHLSKQGVLHIGEIWEFIKIIRYFLYLKRQNFGTPLLEWCANIKIPDEISAIEAWFDKDGNLKEAIDERFGSIERSLNRLKEQISSHLRSIIASSKMQEFLVDTQVHFVGGTETLLLRGGYNAAIKGAIAGRSAGGYFYIAPHSLEMLKKEESDLISRKEELLYEYSKKISLTLAKERLFLKFINKEFDRFDHYIARVMFAKSLDMEFVLPNKSSDIVLSGFSHPALNDPKPVNVSFKKSILLITGVNAGGKTMLLKSMLSAVLLSKYLLPMKINAAHSSIGSFKLIKTIIEDPQNVKNDISTFAGRMVEFSRLFTVNNALVGVDEIELGTDADEAANLFCAILQNLIKKNIKIIITTHHKRLASMLASDESVELLAALYDEKAQKPTFGFLQGTIGKSYAFETAARYGIAQNIVERARALWGEDKEKLNDLIQKNIDLELQSRLKLKELEAKQASIDKLANSLNAQKESFNEEFAAMRAKLESEYRRAIDLALAAAREKESGNIHKLLNQANKAKSEISPPPVIQTDKLSEGDRVKYGNLKGVIKSLKKDTATVEIEGVTMRLPISALKKTSHVQPKSAPQKSTISLLRSSALGLMSLDLHGLRADEAIDKTDKFLSDALLSGYDEVTIYHGIGTGKLAYAIKEFLKTHPSVKSFEDAAASRGGAGATVVRL